MTTYGSIAQVRVLTGLTTVEVPDASITTLLGLADAEIDSLFNRGFGDANAQVDYLSVYLPKRADDLMPNRIMLSKYPVESVTQFLLLDSSGTTTSTLATITTTNISNKNWQTTDYYIDADTGVIELTSQTVQYAPSRAKITYTYGYSTVPVYVQELSATIAAIRSWLTFMGGNYDRLNSYKLPEMEFDKGDFYKRGQEAISLLTNKANDLASLIGEKYKTQFLATSSGYF